MSWRDSWWRGGRVRPLSWKSGLARPGAGGLAVLLWGTGTMWGGQSQAPPELSLCGHGSAPLWEGGGGRGITLSGKASSPCL